MLGALNYFAAAIPASESRQRFGIVVGAIDKIGVALADWPIIHTGHVIVTEAVHVILAQPVLVELEKVVARKLLRVIRSGSACEKLAGENAHHRIGLARSVIDQAVSEFRMRMGIDSVEQDSNAVLMTGVNETLHPRRAAKAIIGREISKRGVSPLDIFLHIGDRHQLQHLDA